MQILAYKCIKYVDCGFGGLRCFLPLTVSQFDVLLYTSDLVTSVSACAGLSILPGL
jgi:hypothetical protein